MIDLSEVEKIYPLVVEYRRHIHENPELGMDTIETKNYVKKLANDLGLMFITSTASLSIALVADSTDSMLSSRHMGVLISFLRRAWPFMSSRGGD